MRTYMFILRKKARNAETMVCSVEGLILNLQDVVPMKDASKPKKGQIFLYMGGTDVLTIKTNPGTPSKLNLKEMQKSPALKVNYRTFTGDSGTVTICELKEE